MGQCAGKESNEKLMRSTSGASFTAASKRRDVRDSYKAAGNKGTGPDFGLGETFEAVEELGEGGSGETWLMLDKQSGGRKVAVKLIRRPIPKVLHEMLLHEIQIQGDLGEAHLNIVNAEEVILTRTHLAIVLEYASGGTLTKYVSDRWDTVNQRGGLFLTEDEARYFFKQFISAVEYCHRHKVAHRDLKLDNTLLDNSEPPCIKICDFGFAKNFDENSNMFTQIGTPVYMSPELISSKRGRVGYDGKKADVWASGVMLFVMLLGMFPYEHNEHPDPNTSAAQIEVWLQQIKQKWRDNSRVKDVAEKLSPECRDMLDKVFELNEKRRIGVDDIKMHPWFNKKMPMKFEIALKKLEKQQDQVRNAAAQANFKTRQRDEMLKDMLSLAARVGNANEPMRRVGLHSEETIRLRKR